MDELPYEFHLEVCRYLWSDNHDESVRLLSKLSCAWESASKKTRKEEAYLKVYVTSKGEIEVRIPYGLADRIERWKEYEIVEIKVEQREDPPKYCQHPNKQYVLDKLLKNSFCFVSVDFYRISCALPPGVSTLLLKIPRIAAIRCLACSGEALQDTLVAILQRQSLTTLRFEQTLLSPNFLNLLLEWLDLETLVQVTVEYRKFMNHVELVQLVTKFVRKGVQMNESSTMNADIAISRFTSTDIKTSRNFRYVHYNRDGPFPYVGFGRKEIYNCYEAEFPFDLFFDV
ncbi:hypothetical protein L596_012184 [Steinernema carpocapsae]|uniref:Uncharacterized protein n=1 Tax=Steinernema carpocapsae TaxID=34508 RepID=A0A4U5NWA4_STECR|nr:hypothetical protein L596_012184 [Steinernema carpocapsae]